MCRQVHELAEKARVGRRAEEPDPLTEVVAAAAAKLTVVAVHSRFKKRPGACCHARNAFTRHDNGADRFVAEHNGVQDFDIADHAVLVIMQIGPANAYVSDTNLDLARSGLCDRRFDQLETALALKFSNFHDFLKRLSNAARASPGVRIS
jgi:hypothetical protein